MRIPFWTIRFYPYWALAVALILLELGLFFKRRRHRLSIAILLWLVAGALLAGVGFWLFHRGDLYSERWVREWMR